VRRAGGSLPKAAPGAPYPRPSPGLDAISRTTRARTCAETPIRRSSVYDPAHWTGSRRSKVSLRMQMTPVITALRSMPRSMPDPDRCERTAGLAGSGDTVVHTTLLACGSWRRRVIATPLRRRHLGAPTQTPGASWNRIPSPVLVTRTCACTQVPGSATVSETHMRNVRPSRRTTALAGPAGSQSGLGGRGGSAAGAEAMAEADGSAPREA
jgi:hypothetical protein